MDKLVVRGGRRLEGSVQIHGAKNAALPQIAASLLTAEPLHLGNMPDLADVSTMVSLLARLGVTAKPNGRTLTLDARNAKISEAPYDIVRRMRATILVLAPVSDGASG